MTAYRKKKVGFWPEGKASRLRAIAKVTDPNWKKENPQAFAAIILYLGDPDSKKRYKGYAKCAVCGKPNGTMDYHKGKWVFPEGYLHYVRDHHVVPCAGLVSNALASMGFDEVAKTWNKSR